jgi:hypothetical protein
MAEVFIIGPLVNLGIYLTQWAYRKYKAKQVDKEHTRETNDLLATVNSLAIFVQEKASVLTQLQQNGIPLTSLGIVAESWIDLGALVEDFGKAYEDCEKALEDKKLSAKLKKLRIEGIHNRLTQSLVLHLGVVMLEVTYFYCVLTVGIICQYGSCKRNSSKDGKY